MDYHLDATTLLHCFLHVSIGVAMYLTAGCFWVLPELRFCVPDVALSVPADSPHRMNLPRVRVVWNRPRVPSTYTLSPSQPSAVWFS